MMKVKNMTGRTQGGVRVSILLLLFLISVSMLLWGSFNKSLKTQRSTPKYNERPLTLLTIANNRIAPENPIIIATDGGYVINNVLADSPKQKHPAQKFVASDSLFQDSVPIASIKGTIEETKYTFYIIAGVFCETKNVQRAFHSMSQKGYKVELLFFRANLSCKRVSIGKYKSLKKAEQSLAIVKSSGVPDAWLLAQRY